MKKNLPGSVVWTSTGSFPTDLPYIGTGTAGDDSTVQSARPVVQVLVLRYFWFKTEWPVLRHFSDFSPGPLKNISHITLYVFECAKSVGLS